MDERIDALDDEIERQVMDLLLSGPLPEETLREVMTISKLAGELERVGDRYRVASIFESENWNEDTRNPLTEPGVDVVVVLDPFDDRVALTAPGLRQLDQLPRNPPVVHHHDRLGPGDQIGGGKPVFLKILGAPGHQQNGARLAARPHPVPNSHAVICARPEG